MLEQQDTDRNCSNYDLSSTIPSSTSLPSLHNGRECIVEEAEENGFKDSSGVGGGGGGEDPTSDAPSSSTTTTTTVRIHTTYKKRASKFTNRPNVQNGLGVNSLNPYGASGGVGGGGGGATLSGGGGGGGTGFGGGSRLVSQNHNNFSTSNNSLHKSSSLSHNHRPIITKSTFFGGGPGPGGGPGGGTTTTTTFSNHNTATTSSPQGNSSTTASTITTTTVDSRPPFVTTVTRGKFLPSKFDLMVEKSLFTFSSRPKPVGLITRHQCSLSGGPLNKENESQSCQPPRGAHDYFNVMWDPHIYRGTTTTLTSSLKPNAELKEERFRKRRAFGSNQGTNNAYNNISPTTTGSRNKYRMTTKVTSRSRTFPPLDGRHQVHVQTEEYLEDFTRDLSRGEVDAIVQTDPIEDDMLDEVGGGGSLKRRYILPEKVGIDASTQVLPGELVSFDERVQPVVEALVGKVLEQALLETMEEEEIAALKAQQNRFVEKRQEEERELKRLQEQQERISAEKERLKRHLQVQLEQQGPRAPSENGGSEDGRNDDIINPSGGGVGSNYLLELLPSVINSLRQEGFLTDQMGDDVLSSFVPMWRRPEGDPDAIGDEDDEGDNSSVENVLMGSQSFPEGYHSRVNSLDEMEGNIMTQQDADPDDEQVVEKSGEDLEDNNANENDGGVVAGEEANCDEQLAEDEGDNQANPEETNDDDDEEVKRDDEEEEVANEDPPPPANEEEQPEEETGEVAEGEEQEAAIEEKEEQLEEGREEEIEEKEAEQEEEAPAETDEGEEAKLEGGEEKEEEDEAEEPDLDKKSEQEEEDSNTDIPDPSIPEEEDNPSPQPQEQLPEAEQAASSSSSSQLPNGAIPNVEARQSSEQD